MKTIKFLLTTIVALSCSIMASAYDFKVDGIYYNITSDTDLTVEVTYSRNHSDRYIGAVTIPSTVTYGSKNYRVTRIGSHAFDECESLHSLTIGSNVLSISINNNNIAAQKIIWLPNTPPENYEYLSGDESIHYVSNHEYTKLGNKKYYDYLSSMFEAGGVKYVPISPSERTCHAIDCAYDSTAAIISIGEKTSFKGMEMEVIGIMSYAFYDNDYIKELSVSHLGDIEDYAFYDCDSIKAIDVSNDGNIGVQAFHDCDGIEFLKVSNQGNIEDRAFYDCNGIKVVDIYNRGYIGNQSFYNCNGIDSLNIANKPNYETSIIVFADCEFRSSSYTKSKTYSFMADEGGTLSFRWSLHETEGGLANLSVTLDGIEVISESGSSTNLDGYYEKALSLGGHTLSIQYNYSGSVTGFNKASVTSIILKTATVAGMGAEAFYGCSSLRAITWGDDVCVLSEKAFSGCTNLQEINIPQSARYVGSHCFSGCTAMKSALIGDKLSSIEEYTFQDCTSLSDIKFGDAVTYINKNAFQNCSSLLKITLPQSVTKVGDYVFSGCSKLSDVIISERTETLALGSNGSSPLFRDCPLDSVYIGGKITYSTSSRKGYSPFYRNTSLRTVVVADTEEQIYENEFYGCTNLKDVVIGNGVKSIGDYAFSGCSSLNEFSFGSNLENIGAEAFSDCTNLTTITSHAAVPPICGSQALDDINKWSCVLRVPQSYAAAYQAADQWKEFFFIEDVVEVKKYALTYMVDGEVYYTDSLAHKEAITTIAEPVKEGYTFSGWNKTVTTMPAGDVVINGTFTINTYKVEYVVDGEIYRTDEVTYNDTLILVEEPTKEGYTFSGWSEAPENMPANDITISGTFAVNSYLLTYTVDGETVQTDSVAYGTAITLLEEPIKEGHTFSGWSEAPETMPASDVIISGTFTVNKYLVTFKIGDEVIAADSLEYGATIVAPEAPEKEGYTFDGWGEVAETVPAGNVTYEGTYTVNIYKVYYYVGEELVHTAEVAYGEAIPEYVYEPTEAGYTFLGWIGDTYETMPAHDVTYTANIDDAIEQLTIDNSQLTIYDLTGRKIEVDDLRELRKGIYVVNGQKIIVKD